MFWPDPIVPSYYKRGLINGLRSDIWETRAILFRQIIETKSKDGESELIELYNKLASQLSESHLLDRRFKCDMNGYSFNVKDLVSLKHDAPSKRWPKSSEIGDHYWLYRRENIWCDPRTWTFLNAENLGSKTFCPPATEGILK
jgi:hypothetical protein